MYPVEYITLTVIHHSNLIGYNLDILNMFLLHFSVAVITRVLLQWRPTCPHAASFCWDLQFHSLPGTKEIISISPSSPGSRLQHPGTPGLGKRTLVGRDDKNGHLPGQQVGFQCQEQTTLCNDAER